MARMRKLPILLCAVSLMGAGAAGDTDIEANIKNLRMGTHWGGPQVQPNDLIGKVVLVEVWGS